MSLTAIAVLRFVPCRFLGDSIHRLAGAMVGPGTVRLRRFYPRSYCVFLANFPRRIGTFGDDEEVYREVCYND